MPKLKTNRGAAKRFLKAANHIKRKYAYHNHILTKKSPKRKRHLRSMGVVDKSDVAAITRLLKGS